MAHIHLVQPWWKETVAFLGRVDVRDAPPNGGRQLEQGRDRLVAWGAESGIDGPGPVHERLQSNSNLVSASELVRHMAERSVPSSALDLYGLRDEAASKTSKFRRAIGIRPKHEDGGSGGGGGGHGGGGAAHPLKVKDKAKFARLVRDVDALNKDLTLLISPEVEAKGLESVQLTLDKHNSGGVAVTIKGPTPESARVCIAPRFRASDTSKEPGTEAADEAAGLPHEAAFELYRYQPFLKPGAPDDAKPSPDDEFFAFLDPESDERYASTKPGTVTVRGYGLECWEYEKKSSGKLRSRDYRLTSFDMPESSPADLLHRLKELQQSVPLGENEAQDLHYLKQFTGNRGIDYGNEASVVVAELIQSLSRRDEFCDFSDATGVTGKLARHEDPKKALWNLFRQIITGAELGRRLSVLEDPSLNNVARKDAIQSLTLQAVSSLIVARLWLKNVEVKSTEDDASLHGLAQQHQRDGLLHFAQALKWPLSEEMQAFVSGLNASEPSPESVRVDLRDWLLGLTLPGQWMSSKIMSALVQATPSLQSLTSTSVSNYGLVLEGCSYWRTRSAVGAVLGSLPGVTSVCGWIGPCPAVDVAKKPACIPLRAPWLSPYPCREQEFGAGDSSERDPYGGVRITEGFSLPNYIELMTADDEYSVPKVPEAGETAELTKIKIEELSPQEWEGDAAAAATAYQANLDFSMGGRSTTFELKTTPVFITPPACRGGPHKLHFNERHRCQGSWPLSMLKYGAVDRRVDKKPLIINATGGPGAETVARAWCAESGNHAVVRRAGGPCLVCCVRLADTSGLGTGVVIWASSET